MKKATKAFISTLLAIVLAFSFTTTAFAKEQITPVIVVHGMGATVLYKNPNTKDQSQVGTFDIGSLLLNHSSLINNIFAAATGQDFKAQDIIDELADYIGEYSDLACDKNGNSAYNVGITNYWTDSLKNHQDYLDSKTSNEPALCKQICKEVGAKNVYAFNYDWRLDAKENGEKLNKFIDTIKKKTNSKKVTLVSGSEGTIVVSAYIDAHKNKNDIKRTVFLDGAFGGVAVTKAYKQDLVFTKDILASYLDELTKTYNNSVIDILKLNRLARSLDLVAGNLANTLNDIVKDKDKLNQVYNNVLYPVLGCIPALWEFIPYNDFNACVKKMSSIGFLDKSGDLYKKITAYHGIQGRLKSNLNELKSNGTEVVIIANYGTPAIPVTSAHANQTDILIDTKYASLGATVADYGKTLNGSGKYFSDDKVIDASSCAFPNSTWFIKGIQHMDFWYDSEATEFVAKLSTSKSAVTIDSIKQSTGNGQFIGTDRQQNIVSVSGNSQKTDSAKTSAKAEIKKSPLTGSNKATFTVGIMFVIFSISIIGIGILERKKKKE